MRSHRRDGCWRPRPAAGTARYRAWLLDRRSLTAKLQQRCATFRVEVVFQGLRRPASDERFLSGRRDSRMLVREVLLRCAGEPVVFAHSVIGSRYLRGVWRGVVRLGTQSLGAALFADPRVTRRPLRFRKLAPGGELHDCACAAVGARLPALWARRSLFVRRNAAMLVTEVFLPGVSGPD